MLEHYKCIYSGNTNIKSLEAKKVMNLTDIFDAYQLTQTFAALKDYYRVDNISPERESYIRQEVQKSGYLRHPHQQALEELSTAETLIGLEEKFKLNGIYNNNAFNFTKETISPIKRAGYTDSSWLRKEQLNVKLINLSALGNGNKDESTPGKFEDWLKQILIAPAGRLDFGVLGTVLYMVPFHPREFGCAYLPTSKFISKGLEDPTITKDLNLPLDLQVKLFLLFSQLAGHPTMYDVLPQTGRYAKTVLANPYIARWFDIPELNQKLSAELELIAEDLKKDTPTNQVESAKHYIKETLYGKNPTISENNNGLLQKIETLLDKKRKVLSEEMMTREFQNNLLEKVKAIIAQETKTPAQQKLIEEDFNGKHGEVTQRLISEGLWPSPGGAWCSSGIPIYRKMVEGNHYPLFYHYDVDGEDVTYMANLDCQTPFYFVHLENGEYNQPVIDFWCDFLVDLQQEFNFDGFRVDHIDHIVDRVSQDREGNPISYRAPWSVLAKANKSLREANPTFGLLAEYMLWERFYKEYHYDMGYDLLWGSDIVSQHLKDIKTMNDENWELWRYNEQFNQNSSALSILKTYNNQDGEFRDIDQYPAQMGFEGALFKWFKLKFTPLCHLAERPVMFIDGDESFTAKGVEKVIGQEISLQRENNQEFFRRFDALNRFALNNIFTRFGITEIHHRDPKTHLIAWTIKKQPEFGDDERLFVIAHEKPAKEVNREIDEQNQLYSVDITFNAINNARVEVPQGFIVESEYILPENERDYIESYDLNNLHNYEFTFETLQPAEFHFYKIRRF